MRLNYLTATFFTFNAKVIFTNFFNFPASECDHQTINNH